MLKFGSVCYMKDVFSLFFFSWCENTAFNQDMIHPFKNNMKIPCDRNSATPNRALCSTQKRKNKELLQP